MAVISMGGASAPRREQRQSRFADALAALSAIQTQQAAPPPMPEIPLPPVPSLPPPQPVAVEDPVAMLSRAVAGLPGLPTINTLQTLASLAEATSQNLLQSRLAAQEQALQQALGLGNLALNRAQLQLEQAQEQRLRQQAAEEARQNAQAREEALRNLALTQVQNVLQTAPDPESARNQIDLLRSIFPELRYILTDAMIEQALRAKFGTPVEEQAQGSRGNFFMDVLVPFSERYLMWPQPGPVPPQAPSAPPAAALPPATTVRDPREAGLAASLGLR